MIKPLAALLLLILISSCAGNQSLSTKPAERKFSIDSMAKNDIDNILDIQVYQLRDLLRQLMIKLYKRNPKQLQSSPFNDIDKNVSRVFDEYHDWSFKQLDYKKSIEALELTFDDNYQGDRVFSFVVGLSSMLMGSYGNKIDFYMLDKVDEQLIYNSARNIEIAIWKINNNKDNNGEFFLYTDSLPNEQTYLSYERLFGKMIAIQDTTAKIIANNNNRMIRKMIQKIATTLTFLPI